MTVKFRRLLALVAVALLTACNAAATTPGAPATEAAGEPGAGEPAGSSAPSPQADGYLETVRLFHAALKSGDGRGALVRLAEDVTIFETGGAEMSRTEYAEHHLGGDTRFAASTERTTTDQQHGEAGAVAWVTSRTETHGTFGEREIHSRGTETMLLRREGGEWRIFHIHWSSRSIE
jgi:ketosteroid isomerase-like protein